MPAGQEQELWLSLAERLASLPTVMWEQPEITQARQLLATGIVLVKGCRVGQPTADIAQRLVERSQCLARCAEDLSAELVKAVPSDGRPCGLCQDGTTAS